MPDAPPGGFLAGLGVDDRTALFGLARRRTYPAGSVVLFEGDPAHDVVVVDDGYLKVAATVEDREVVLDVLGPGAVLGELGAVDGSCRSARATALTSVAAWSVPADAFNELLAAGRASPSRSSATSSVASGTPRSARSSTARSMAPGACAGVWSS